jgi:hypothetical protein
MFAALHSTMWAWAGPENLLDWISDETIFHFGRGAVGWEFSGEARTHTPPTMVGVVVDEQAYTVGMDASGEARTHTPPMMSVDLPGETMPAMVGVVVDEQARYTVGMDASGEAHGPVSKLELAVETMVGFGEQACTRWNPSEEQARTSVTCQETMVYLHRAAGWKLVLVSVDCESAASCVLVLVVRIEVYPCYYYAAAIPAPSSKILQAPPHRVPFVSLSTG